MRVTILTQWFPPEPIRIPLDLALGLQRRGWDVEVVTGFPNYPSGKLYPGFKLRPWMRETIEGIAVTRVWLYPDHSRSAAKRILNYASFALSAALLPLFLTRRPNVVFVYGSPYTPALAAIFWRLVRRVPFVFHLQDMWPEGLQAVQMVRSRTALRAAAVFCKVVYRAARRIIAISPGFRSNLLEKGVPAAKVDYVSNWVDVEHYRPMERDAALAERLGAGSGFNVMYAGAIGAAQGLDVVVDAAVMLRDLPDVAFLLVGDGVDRERLQRRARELELQNVRFLGAYAEKEMPPILALADVLLVHLRNDPIFRITIPHKVLSYMATGKPLLCAVEGDAAAVIREAGAGIAAPPGDAAALANAVRSLRAMPAQQRSALGDAGRRAAVERYSREHAVEQIAAILESAVTAA